MGYSFNVFEGLFIRNGPLNQGLRHGYFSLNAPSKMPPRKRFSKTSITPLKIWYSLLYQNDILDRLCEARHRQAMTVAFPLLLGELLFFGAYYPARKTSGGSRRDRAIYHCRITFSESMSCRTIPARGKLLSA